MAGKGLGGMLRGLVLKHDAAAQASEDGGADAPVDASDDETLGLGDVSSEPDSGAPIVVASGLAAATLATIYEQAGVTGDPHTDKLLDSFARVAAAEKSAQHMAMGVVIEALSADVGAVSKTLADRAKVLGLAVQQQSQTAAQNKQARGEQLEATQLDVGERVAKLEAEIAQLRQTQQQATEQAAAADADEARATTEFQSRVATETARLAALQQFLVTMKGKE